MARLISGFLWIAIAASTEAATISIAPAYVQSLDSSLTTLGKLPSNGAATPVGGYMQFEFRMTLAGAAPGEDFWTAVFDIDLGPGLSNYSGWLDPASAQANGFYPTTPALDVFDSNGSASGGMQSHWQYANADFGIDANDLRSIIVEASPAEAANRQYGETLRPGAGLDDGLGYPTLLGTLIVQRTALVPTSITLRPIAGSSWGLYIENVMGNGSETNQRGSSFASSAASIDVPEPKAATQAILGIAVLCLICKKKVPLSR